MRRAVMRFGLGLALVGGVLCAAPMFFGAAEARLGGGHTYGGGSSGGGSSGGSSWGGGSSNHDSSSSYDHSSRGDSASDGGEMDPRVAIGFLLILVVFVIWVKIDEARRKRQPRGAHVETYASTRPPPRPKQNRAVRLTRGLAELQARDPAFSRFVFLDVCTLLYMRFLEGLGGGDFAGLRPYVKPSLHARLGRHAVDSVRDAVVGGVRLVSVGEGRETRVAVEFEASYREMTKGRTTHRYVREQWTFVRPPGVTSPEPEAAIRLGCPSCGAAAELDVMGRCRYCEQVVTNGRFGWQVGEMKVRERAVVTRLPVGLGPGGPEPGTFEPTRRPADYRARTRAFRARNPGFSKAAFEERARFIFMNLQAAWSALEWEKARPYESDALFQSHRYWIERYREDGLRNVLEDIQLTRINVCNYEQDAYYEAITARMYASMLDYTVDQQGAVVGGNRQRPHEFTEYWTFIRRSGVEQGSTDPEQCPSCAAEMKVNQAGQCDYCGTRVVSGEFDWVLALIEQDDAYTV